MKSKKVMPTKADPANYVKITPRGFFNRIDVTPSEQNKEGEEIEKIDPDNFMVIMHIGGPSFFRWPREAYYVHAEPLRKKLLDDWKKSK